MNHQTLLDWLNLSENFKRAVEIAIAGSHSFAFIIVDRRLKPHLVCKALRQIGLESRVVSRQEEAADINVQADFQPENRYASTKFKPSVEPLPTMLRRAHKIRLIVDRAGIPAAAIERYLSVGASRLLEEAERRVKIDRGKVLRVAMTLAYMNSPSQDKPLTIDIAQISETIQLQYCSINPPAQPDVGPGKQPGIGELHAV